MNLKTLAIVVAVLAVASIATRFFQQQDQPRSLDPRIGQPLVPADVIPQVARVQIDSNTGTAVTLEATNPNGSNWVVREYHDLPVDFSKLNTLVQNLRDATFTRFGSRNPERIERMDFNGQRIALQDTGGDTLWSARLGRTLTGGRFVMVGDEETALVASFSAHVDTTPKNWAQAALISAEAEDVRSIEVTFPEEEPLRFHRDDATTPWAADELPEGATIKTSELSPLLNRLVGLRFSDTTEVDAPEVVAARENARDFKIGLASGTEFSISLGRQPAPPAPPPAEDEEETDDTDSADEPAEAEPEPGPVFAFVRSSTDESFNERMNRRGYQIQEWTYTSLPENRAALIEQPEATAPEAREEAEATPEAGPTAEPEIDPGPSTAEPATNAEEPDSASTE